MAHRKQSACAESECGRTQYIEFLADTLPAAEYAALLPPLQDLVLGFGVDPEVAFKASTSSPACPCSGPTQSWLGNCVTAGVSG